MRIKQCIICALIIFFFVLFFKTSLFSQDKNLFGKITKNGINIRSDSTTGATSLGLLENDEIVEIVGDKYSWHKIIIPERFSFYVNSQYIKAINKKEVKVTATVLNLRSGPSLDSPIIGKAKQEDTLRFISRNANWTKVAASRNTYGWVHKNFVSIIEFAPEKDVEAKPKEIVKDQKLKEKTIKEEDDQKVSWDDFISKGTLVELTKLKDCEANYKLRSGYTAIFLKIDSKVVGDSFLDKEVIIKGKRRHNGCSYVEVDNIIDKK